MKYYKPKQLFIGSTGYTTGARDKLEFEEDFISIVKRTTNKCIYADIFSNEKYEEFYILAGNGSKTIFKPTDLNTFFINLLKDNDTNDEIINSIYKKILNNQYISEKELKQLLGVLNGLSINIDKVNSKYFTVLSNKKFKLQPCIGRDNEFKNLLLSIAESNKLTLLIGKRGVGKTAIINELIYRIKNNNIPKFLKKKIIIELNLSQLFFNPDDIESIANSIVETIAFAKKSNAIIYINNIEVLNKDNLKCFEFLKKAIKKFNLKMIGSTTDEKLNNLFLDDTFNKIYIEEPDENTLYDIIEKTFKDYSKINNISIPNDNTFNSIIKSLILLTNKENRISTNTLNKPHNEELNNPGLIIEIIDKIFAHAKVFEQKKLTKEDIIYGINNCNKITNEAKTNSIKVIEKIFKKTEKDNELIVKPDKIRM